uniref:Uncharacterized protein n=1 Tax=Bactrocera latifrons TaxID=174628 RepID=A0A0K8WIM6_BACLA
MCLVVLIMASSRLLCEESIMRLLMDEDDDWALEELSDSETEDTVLVDNVESDNQSEESSLLSGDEDVHEGVSGALMNDVPGLATPSASNEVSSGSDPSILAFSSSTIRSRSRHVWATRKGRTSNRAAAINIVRGARGQLAQ